MRHQFLLLVCAMPFLAACSFNKKFLYPTPYPANTDTMTLASSTDTLKIAIAPGTYQPTFFKNNNDSVQIKFTLESVVFENTNRIKLHGWVMKPG